MSSIQETVWGTVNDHNIKLYTLTNGQGMKARITNYGAIMTELHVLDRDGNSADVVLGFDSLEGYIGNHPFFGATVGRVANRIANSTFSIDGLTYAVDPNEGRNHIHGGFKGFDKRVWDVPSTGQALDDVFVKLALTSQHGDQGYPGRLEVSVFYTLTHDNILRIEMEAETDAPTIVNLSNHSYYNLAGHNDGSILNHEASLSADQYTPTAADRIPTGEIAPVSGGPFDFTAAKQIGQDLWRMSSLGPEDPGGYDHNFVVRNSDGTLRHAATMKEGGCGRVMEVHTNQPGVQFYTANYLDGSITGKSGAVYGKHGAFCLETQKYPNAINKLDAPGWPSVILRPGEVYRHEVEYRFAAEQVITVST
ncbi:MAG: aldose epimerase family protein [Gemmatimonadota bacterium]|nr:aldose epimerase family protein [Gemmatimonadota bacterium]